MKLYFNAQIFTQDDNNPAANALLTQGETLVWVGDIAACPHIPLEKIDLKGALVTPALIDCHTHLVYGGNRAKEFELRLEGASYEEIAKAGGGIRSTVKATREASEEELFQSALKRAKILQSFGVTTLEIKSGYGLTEHDEARMLRVARRLGREMPLDVFTTYLAAHALPPEFEGKADDYIEATNAWLPRLYHEGLVDAVDAFCEGIGFSNAQTRKVFEAAKALNLPVKLHAEQLSDLEGASLAASFNALSCDHLEYLSPKGIHAMKAADTVAVLLPAAYYFIRETKKPPVEALRAAGVKIALATDHNPGSSPMLSPLLTMNMAATLFRMTPQECLKGFTLNAAAALGLKDRGVLASGKRADFAVWDVGSLSELTYWIGGNPLIESYYKGEKR